jgi:hypothetical protein
LLMLGAIFEAIFEDFAAQCWKANVDWKSLSCRCRVPRTADKVRTQIPLTKLDLHLQLKDFQSTLAFQLQMQVEFRQGYLSSNLVGSSRDSRRLWTRPHSKLDLHLQLKDFQSTLAFQHWAAKSSKMAPSTPALAILGTRVDFGLDLTPVLGA